MFERRLKIILSILFVFTAVLALRAAQLQVWGRGHWVQRAAETLRREQTVETTRGTIYDVKGAKLAEDVACVDACVDYRAVIDPPDDLWVTRLAQQWARQRRADEWRSADSARRRQIVQDEKRHVLSRIQIMWATLAQVSGRRQEEIDETRSAITRRVEMRRRYVWYRKYELAQQAHDAQAREREPSWWKQWLIDDNADAPQLDEFDVRVAEQSQPHPVLRDIPSDLQNRLGKMIDDMPGLVLRPGVTRAYPGGEAACHLIGHLSRVRREDLQNDPNSEDELRRFQYNDLIGRSGLEALCEPLLRGTRGRIERFVSETDDVDGSNVLSNQAPASGKNVTVTIDIGLQQEVVSFFKNAQVTLLETPERKVRRPVDLHGGAVVIDVRSGEVRALVSNPTFDPNRLEENYTTLAKDQYNRPLMSRATQYPLETGSTIKPVVGLAAVTQGLIGANDGIECTGYLVLNGRRYGVGRCWVTTKFGELLGATGVAHHPVPHDAPHRGHDGNADGFLTLSDALERSCNIYFETIAARMGLEGLSHWMERFGLGRITGIGIEESRGRLPISYTGPNVEYTTWVAGIGQGQIAATPLQMANVAATIARGGVWMRPSIVPEEHSKRLRELAPATTQPSWRDVPDRIDLKLSPDALAAAREGMRRVVNSPGGTGRVLRSDLVEIAGKTGTAEAARFLRPVSDGQGGYLRDERGKIVREPIPPSTADRENPDAPWYLGFDADGKNLKHAWIIGYAPARDPQVAFAVMVEYGGSGGQAAATIAHQMLDACIQHGYLSPQHREKTTRADE